MLTTEQFNASQKAQMSQWFDLVGKTLDEAEKIFQLNLTTCRDCLEQMASSCQNACDIRDMSSALSWQTAVLKPLAENSAQYGARLMGLAAVTGREFGHTFEHQWQDLSRQMSSWTGDVPLAGRQDAESAFGLLGNTMKALDSFWVSARQNLAQSQQAFVQSESPAAPVAKRVRKAM